MAAPTNVITSATPNVGVREDLEDVIYRVAPEKTPFSSNIGSTKANQTYHEWQIEALATPSADNAQLEGDDVTDVDAGNLPTRVGNTCQILRKTGGVSRTQQQVKLAGRDNELARQKVLKGLELNRATARALQYGRSLHPSEIRAVHLNVDDQAAAALSAQWTTLGLGRIPLEVVDCPDRRIENAALQVTADESLSGDREVTVLLPRLEYRRAWHRLLHDRTGNRIAAVVADLPRVNVTFVPYHLSAGGRERSLSVADVIEQHADSSRRAGAPGGSTPRALDGDAELDERLAAFAGPASTTSPNGIGSAPRRARVTLTGRVQAIRVQPWSGVATLEITLVDETGSIQLVFLGRRTIAGISTGMRLQASGVVSEHRTRRSILNPTYRILA